MNGEQYKDFKNDINNLMKSNTKALMATLENETNKVSGKVDKIAIEVQHVKEKVDGIAGRCDAQDEQIVSLQKSASACRSHRHTLDAVWKNRRWIFGGLVVLIVVIVLGVNKVNWYRTVEKKFNDYGIVLKEPNDTT